MATRPQDMEQKDPNLVAAYKVIGNQNRDQLQAMVKALSLHTWLNTAEDKRQLAAAQYILEQGYTTDAIERRREIAALLREVRALLRFNQVT